MNIMQEMVREFHETFGAPVRNSPGHTDRETEELRVNLMREELLGKNELVESIYNQDLVGIADGIADLLYVTIGTAVVYGMDVEALVAEAHRSNMSKLGADGKPIYREDGKVLKGPKFFEPDFASVLGLKSPIPEPTCPCGFAPYWLSDVRDISECHGVPIKGVFAPESCGYDQHRCLFLYCPAEGCKSQWDIDLTREEEKQYEDREREREERREEECQK